MMQNYARYGCLLGVCLMSFERTDDDILPRDRLYILYPETQATAVYRAIANHSHVAWQSQGRIHYFAVPRSRCRDTQFITGRINQLASRLDGTLHVLTLSPVQFDNARLRDDIGI